MSDRIYAANQVSTTLSADMDAAVSSIPVNSTAGFPDAAGADDYFIVTVNDEIMLCSGKGTGSLTVATRGYDGSTANSHSKDDRVTCKVVAAHINKVYERLEAAEGTVSDLETSIPDLDSHTTQTTATDDVHSSKTYIDAQIAANLGTGGGTPDNTETTNNWTFTGTVKLPTTSYIGSVASDPHSLVTKHYVDDGRAYVKVTATNPDATTNNGMLHINTSTLKLLCSYDGNWYEILDIGAATPI